MSRLRPPAHAARTRSTHRTACALSVAVLLGLACAGASAAAVLSIAVAPFEGDQRRPSVAQQFADALARRGPERLLSPGSFVAKPGVDVGAATVRRWAYNAAVETLVVGRVVAATRFAPERVEIAVRSGHSGAEVARYERTVDAEAWLAQAIEELADRVVTDLGHESPPHVGPMGAAVSGPAAAAPAAPGGRGLDARLEMAGFDSNAPIEIEAEEAEIMSRDEGRELVFQHNVLVRQANVTLRSDRLEASYEQGQSEPQRLVAHGSVQVDQGERRARCDRAIYQRAARKLICSGHAELIQGCDVVRGESIQFDLDRDRARVEGAASIVIRPEEGREGNGCAAVEGLL